MNRSIFIKAHAGGNCFLSGHARGRACRYYLCGDDKRINGKRVGLTKLLKNNGRWVFA